MIASVPTRAKRADRRDAIADAGIHLLASGGARALTHRAIDNALELPEGSTSYYARTRQDLVRLIVDKLAERSRLDVQTAPLPEEFTVERAAAVIARGLAGTRIRTEDHRARITLLIEYRSDPEMRRNLAGNPPLRPQLVATAEAVLARLGVHSPEQHAHNLVALVDSLLMANVVHGEQPDAERIIRAYLLGIGGAG